MTHQKNRPRASPTVGHRNSFLFRSLRRSLSSPLPDPGQPSWIACYEPRMYFSPMLSTVGTRFPQRSSTIKTDQRVWISRLTVPVYVRLDLCSLEVSSHAAPIVLYSAVTPGILVLRRTHTKDMVHQTNLLFDPLRRVGSDICLVAFINDAPDAVLVQPVS